VTVEHADDFVQVACGELLEKVLAQNVGNALRRLSYFHGVIPADLRKLASSKVSRRSSPCFGALYAG
jgi:hypothetical protein